jgi:hypothetical protein
MDGIIRSFNYSYVYLGGTEENPTDITILQADILTRNFTNMMPDF